MNNVKNLKLVLLATGLLLPLSCRTADVTITWDANDPTDLVQYYNVYSFGTFVGRATNNAIVLKLHGMQSISVTAFNGAESPPSTNLVFKALPDRPRGLTNN